jgi:hypothetical protein
MWEEKNRYIVKLVKQVMNEMKGESKWLNLLIKSWNLLNKILQT